MKRLLILVILFNFKGSLFSIEREEHLKATFKKVFGEVKEYSYEEYIYINRWGSYFFDLDNRLRLASYGKDECPYGFIIETFNGDIIKCERAIEFFKKVKERENIFSFFKDFDNNFSFKDYAKDFIQKIFKHNHGIVFARDGHQYAARNGSLYMDARFCPYGIIIIKDDNCYTECLEETSFKNKVYNRDYIIY